MYKTKSPFIFYLENPQKSQPPPFFHKTGIWDIKTLNMNFFSADPLFNGQKHASQAKYTAKKHKNCLFSKKL